MKFKRLYILGLLSLLFIVASLWFLFKKESQQNTLTLYGNIDVRQVNLGFRVAGRVEKMLVEEGDVVKKGELLAWLDKVPLREEVRQAKARVASLQASLKNAQSILKRREEVVGIVSEEEYKNALFTAEKQEADLQGAKAALDAALTRYEDTKIIAPIDGTILTRIREPGTVVTVGEPIYSLSITSPLWARAYISEPYLGKIFPGMHVIIETDTDTLPQFHGWIGFISPEAEFTPKNVETVELRTDLVYRLRIIIEDPNKRLHQGMPVTIKIPLSQKVSD